MLAALILAVSGSAYGLGPEWQPVANPLAEARAGRIYCDMPNHEKKSCEGASVYRFDDAGGIMEAGLIPINNEPDLTVGLSTAAWEEDGAICSKPAQEDFDRIRLLVGAKPYEGPAADELLAPFKQKIAKMLVGKTVCERIFRSGDRLFSVTIVDGVHRAEFDGEIAWLDPEDMYDLRTTENILDE